MTDFIKEINECEILKKRKLIKNKDKNKNQHRTGLPTFVGIVINLVKYSSKNETYFHGI